MTPFPGNYQTKIVILIQLHLILNTGCFKYSSSAILIIELAEKRSPGLLWDFISIWKMNHVRHFSPSHKQLPHYTFQSFLHLLSYFSFQFNFCISFRFTGSSLYVLLNVDSIINLREIPTNNPIVLLRLLWRKKLLSKHVRIPNGEWTQSHVCFKKELYACMHMCVTRVNANSGYLLNWCRLDFLLLVFFLLYLVLFGEGGHSCVME